MKTRAGEASENARLVAIGRKLRSLQGGDAAVLEAIAAGEEAIPVLRELLFERDRAGIFEPRKRAVRALAALGASDVLGEFLSQWRAPEDPVERLGDEAVVNAAARALARISKEEAYPLLARLASKHPTAGVLEALFRSRPEGSFAALLVRALEDDCAADTAAEALRAMGQQAVAVLVDAVRTPVISPGGGETASSLRRRRRALSLLREIGATREIWQKICPLIDESDGCLAVQACAIGMACAAREQARACAARLLELLNRLEWFERRLAEDCLVEHFGGAGQLVRQEIQSLEGIPSRDRAKERMLHLLKRVAARGARDDRVTN